MIATSSTKVVTADHPCCVCGYSLRTQPVLGVCPECGTPVEQSLSRWGLAAATDRWLRRTFWGAAIVLATSAATLALSVRTPTGPAALMLGPAGTKAVLLFNPVSYSRLLLQAMVFVPLAILRLWGIFLLTRRDEDCRDVARGVALGPVEAVGGAGLIAALVLACIGWPESAALAARVAAVVELPAIWFMHQRIRSLADTVEAARLRPLSITALICHAAALPPAAVVIAFGAGMNTCTYALAVAGWLGGAALSVALGGVAWVARGELRRRRE